MIKLCITKQKGMRQLLLAVPMPFKANPGLGRYSCHMLLLSVYQVRGDVSSVFIGAARRSGFPSGHIHVLIWRVPVAFAYVRGGKEPEKRRQNGGGALPLGF